MIPSVRLALAGRHPSGVAIPNFPVVGTPLQSLRLSGSIDTAFVERINLTLRHAMAALSPLVGHHSIVR